MPRYHEEQQLELIRMEQEHKERLSRRGSWFVVPTIEWEDRRSHQSHTSSALSSMTMDEQRKIYDRNRLKPAMAQRYIDLGGDSGTSTALMKTDRFLSACNVVCVHCQYEFWFEEVRLRWRCSNLECCELLWPNGGFIEANIVRQLTGDFQAFNTMLAYPPLVTHGK